MAETKLPKTITFQGHKLKRSEVKEDDIGKYAEWMNDEHPRKSEAFRPASRSFTT